MCRAVAVAEHSSQPEFAEARRVHVTDPMGTVERRQGVVDDVLTLWCCEGCGRQVRPREGRSRTVLALMGRTAGDQAETEHNGGRDRHEARSQPRALGLEVVRDGSGHLDEAVAGVAAQR